MRKTCFFNINEAKCDFQSLIGADQTDSLLHDIYTNALFPDTGPMIKEGLI